MPSSARWPEGEEHYAKLAINSLVGLFARNLELVYSMKTSNHQVDGEGCSWRQTFTDAAGGTHWDHVFVTELLSNSSYRPVHDFIMGAEYVAVARIRQALAAVPKRYLKCIKTDCLVMQDVSKKYRPAVERLLKMSHRDGTPVYRYEEVTGLKGQYREPTWAKAPWRRVDIITKTHAAVQSVGLGAQTAGHWVRRNVRNGHCSATWLVIEELTQLDTPLWADIACLSMNKKINRFLLLGDFRQLPAVLDSFAGAEVCRELKDSQLLHDLAGGWCHELSERWRFDERIFEFLTWLRVDEPEQVPLAEAVREARRRFPRRGGARREPGHLPCQAAADQRAGEPQARARRCSGGAVRGPRRGADECAADHEGLAGAAVDRGRRQGAEGHLPDRGSRGGRRRPPGERAMLRGPRAAEAHSALQRDYSEIRPCKVGIPTCTSDAVLKQNVSGRSFTA